MAIYFYSRSSQYGEFSNFSLHGFELDGAWWPTVEHYFQAQKFPGTEQAEKIRLAEKPAIAKRMGRSRKHVLRPDWEEVKDDVMRRAVRQKFESHPELRELLLATGDEELIENAPGDYYWGCGKTGTGRNMLGKILMEVRTSLRAAVPLEAP
jgi:N-glycosidase YbiA